MTLAATPMIYYYPDPAGSLETIDLVHLTDLRVVHDRSRVDAESLTGRIISQEYGGRTRVGITRAGVALTATQQRALRTLEIHLRRGGLVGFSLRQDKAWAAWATSSILRGATTARHTGVGFYEPTATLAASDEVVIQSANPERSEEVISVSLAGSAGINFGESVRMTYRRTPILIRWTDYYPILRLDPAAVDQPLLTHESRIRWTLDLPLVEDPEVLEELSARGGAALRTATTPGNPSLTQALPSRAISPQAPPIRQGGRFGGRFG